MSDAHRGGYGRDEAGHDPAAFDDMDDDGAGRGPMLLGVAFAVVVAFAAVVWSAYHQGVRGRNDPPIITAAAEPYRATPEDPGGAETRHLDIEVFDRLNGARSDRSAAMSARGGEEGSARESETDSDEVATPTGARFSDEALAAIQHESEARAPLTAETTDAAAGEGSDEGADEVADENALAFDSALGDGADAETADEAGSGPIVLASNEPEGVAEPGAPMIRLRPEWRTIGPDGENAEAGEGEGAEEDGAGEAGDFVVQLASHRSEDAAQTEWSAIQSRLPDLLNDREPEIVMFDAGDRGIFYRLRLAGFNDQERANAFCDLLQARGQDCLTVRN